MLIRPHDDATLDEARWRSFVTASGFGHFVAPGESRAFPAVVPTQFELDGDRVIFHLSTLNPVVAALDENPTALMSVAGDWAYIPGKWRVRDGADPATGIPTTYYAAVQLMGTANVHDEPEAIAAILRRQLRALEPDTPYVDPLDHGAMLRGIRGVELHVSAVRAKFKYGANASPAERAAVRAKLIEREQPGDLAAVRHMR